MIENNDDNLEETRDIVSLSFLGGGWKALTVLIAGGAIALAVFSVWSVFNCLGSIVVGILLLAIFLIWFFKG